MDARQHDDLIFIISQAILDARLRTDFDTRPVIIAAVRERFPAGRKGGIG